MEQMKMARLSGAAVLLLVVVPLCMYSGALFVGIQLGRALERRPDSVSISIRGLVDYFSKELWDTERRGWISVGGGERAVQYYAEPVPLRPMQPKRSYVRPVVDDDAESSATPQGRSNNYNRNHTSPRGVISVGPWGGSGGQPFYMRGGNPPQLRSIILYHSDGAIHSLACEYSRAGDDGSAVNRMAGPWGLPNSFGSRAVRAVINLRAGEHVTAVEGSTGRFGNVPGVVITSLTFRSNTGRTYGPFGDKEGAGSTRRFSVPVAAGGCIAGFWGRSGWLLDAVGVYIGRCEPARADQRPGMIKIQTS